MLKEKLLNTMNNKRITSDKFYEASSQIITNKVYKIKSTVLKSWFELYKEISTQRIKVI